MVKDIGDDSYINFEMLMSLSSFPRMKTNGLSWIWTQLETFILIEKGTDIENTRMKLKPIPRKYLEGSFQDAMNMSFDEYIKSGKAWDLYLQPLTQIHLYSDNVVGNSNAIGNLKIVYTLVGTAIFIILLSCINFMNLSTAQFTRRIKEASIRKILGLNRKELGLGYFFEAFSFCLIALVVAFAFTQTILPWFNQVTGKTLEMDIMRDSGLVAMVFLLLFFMSTISGSFPALFLSAFHPVDAMKGKLKTGREGKGFRNGLVVVQFTVSIALIICTTLVFQQLNFFSAKNLGFDKENLLVIDHAERTDNGATLTDAISGIPGVINTSFCTALPLHMGNDWFKPRDYGDLKLFFASADEHYLSTLGIELIVGRNFSASDSIDVDQVILNETAVKTLGWLADESVIGKIIDYPNADTQFQVMGVVRDYNFASLDKQIEPMGIFHMNSKVWNQRKYVLVRIAPQDNSGWESTFIALKKVWKQHAGDQPFKYEFVDQGFAAKLQTQQQFGKALQIMASLAILIACLGLLGMVIYTLEQRTKEIGIRKISGAGIWNIIVLISQGYTKLVIIAFAIAAPLSFWLIQQWLHDFANRITPSVWTFVLTGLGTLLFSFLITSYHSVKAALTNPIDVLKDE